MLKQLIFKNKPLAAVLDNIWPQNSISGKRA
jgi:hypothetical protein